jgi:glycogen(starch) synthase
VFGWLRRIARGTVVSVARLLGHRRQDVEPFSVNPWKQNDRVEKMHSSTAEIVTSPSLDLMHYAHQKWDIPPSRMLHVPYPYTPTPEHLSVPLDTKTDRIAFLGRLETRKGVLDLAIAIPLVLERCPQATFRFIGRDCWLPRARRCAIGLIRERLGLAERSVEFTGALPLDSIPNQLADVDICVFPSIWENFPNVCLEAMAAARGIVASNAGGMAEMLKEDAGLLVPPKNPQAIAEAVASLLLNPTRRIACGRRARRRLLANYNRDRIGSLMEEAFKAACQREAVDANKTASDHFLPRDSISSCGLL